MRVGLILTTYGFWDMTERALDSLLTAGGEFRLLVVDGGSRDGTVEEVSRRGLQVLVNPASASLAVALNQWLHVLMADSDLAYLGWIQNDMVFFPGWLEGLVRVLQEHPEVGKLAAWNLQGDPDSYDPSSISAFMRDHCGHLESGNGNPWIVPRSVVERVGPHDEGYLDQGEYEDWDYNNRVLEAGFRVMITKESAVWHQGMGTRSRMNQGDAPWRNMARYNSKWGPGPRV